MRIEYVDGPVDAPTPCEKCGGGRKSGTHFGRFVLTCGACPKMDWREKHVRRKPKLAAA